MARQISDGRKALYYIGGGIQIIGLILFLSNFALVGCGIQSGFDDGPGFFSSFVGRGFGGFILIFVGGIINRIGARGLAGSGVVLDPGRAREELEPFSRMGGGMVKDAIDEAGLDLSKFGDGKPTPDVEKIIMIKCRDCGKLNEEDSKFCQECGQPM